MRLTIDLASKVPLYQQIRDAIVNGIATGTLANGTVLPSIRALGNELGVNLHTVNKAYQALQQEGFVVIQRGRGAVVQSRGALNKLSRTFYGQHLKKSLPKRWHGTLTVARCIK